MPRPSFVIFDLDGTLADTGDGILHSFHLTLSDLGRHASDDELRDLIGPPLDESFARLGFADGEIANAVVLYRAYYDREGVDRCSPYDGIEELLDELRSDSVVLAVATAKRVDFAVRVLDNLGILDYFQSVSGASLDGSLDTKQGIVSEALRLLGEPAPEEGWMVGDRREDILAARSHSLYPVGALWGYGSRTELVESGAELLVATPSEIIR